MKPNSELGGNEIPNQVELPLIEPELNGFNSVWLISFQLIADKLT